ncbi:uncharacterized protein LOC127715960 [Mytilus californianus]|uniref:uncharacterized protein LOC127715960 n=1 Tax=Mytilus californianus TaxID=6549 RepID=UPI00224614E7|nr:uncharacterized protein LOC127715960 [Mytilus californianus]
MVAADSLETLKKKDQNSTIPCDVPVLTELPLPDFSLYVKQCLRNKESAKVWNKVVDEAANFYLAFYPNDVDNQKAYRIIGQKLYRAFPDIKREGELPWSKLLSNEDYESHILEMKKEFEKLNSNESHLRLLLKESISNRRDWIRNVSGGRVNPILEKFPCFECGKYIWEEFKIIMTEEVQMDMEVIGSNLEKILRCLTKDIPKKELKEAEYKVPSLIRHLEKRNWLLQRQRREVNNFHLRT